MRTLILLLAALIVYWLLRREYRKQPIQAFRYLSYILIGGSLGLVLYFAATGRLHWFFALIATLLASTKWLLGLLQWLPLARTISDYLGFASTVENRDRSDKATSDMVYAEALATLGLQEGATKDQIVSAHKRLIQKFHPDRGGSDHLAAKINQAKDLLLKRN